MAWGSRSGDTIAYDLHMARTVSPLKARRPALTNFPVTPPVAAVARAVVGGHTGRVEEAAGPRRYLARTFRYVADPSTIGRRMTVDDFLLRERRGHCEYFAAGMVALLTSLGTPPRRVGGFYGGKLTPRPRHLLGGRRGAHAGGEGEDGAGGGAV